MRWEKELRVSTMNGSWFYNKKRDVPIQRKAYCRKQTNKQIEPVDGIEIKKSSNKSFFRYQILFGDLSTPSWFLDPGDEL